jgi:hypothetical protein
LNLDNASFAKITGVLTFRPYCIIEYKLDLAIMDKRGKTNRICDASYCVVNSITEDIVHESDKDGLSNDDLK